MESGALIFFGFKPNFAAGLVCYGFDYIQPQAVALGILFLYIISSEHFSKYFIVLFLGDAITGVGYFYLEIIFQLLEFQTDLALFRSIFNRIGQKILENYPYQFGVGLYLGNIPAKIGVHL